MICIDDFHSSLDGDDWLPAFRRAQTAHGTQKSSYSYSGGFTLHFSPRSYYFSGPIHILCPMTLMGSGASLNHGTTLMFPKGSRGIVVHGSRTCRIAKYMDPPDLTVDFNVDYRLAQGTCIEKLQVLAVDPVTKQPAPTHLLSDLRESTAFPNPGPHGIMLLTLAALRDVSVAHFDGHGIYIFGNGDDDPLAKDPAGDPDLYSHASSIAAFCQIINCVSVRNGGDGLHIYGNDASGTMVQSCQFIHNGGWGVQDFARIGQSTYLGGQCAYNLYGGFSRPFDVMERDYETFAARVALDPGLNVTYAALVAAAPGAIAAAGTKPDPSAFPPMTTPIQDHLGKPSMAVFMQAYSDYRKALAVYHAQIGDQLELVLLAVGIAVNRALTHQDQLVPYADGSAVLVGLYAEGNGIDGTANELGRVNMSFATLAYDKTATIGIAANGYGQNVMLGTGGVALQVNNSIPAPASAQSRPISYSAVIPTEGADNGAIAFNSNAVSGGNAGWIFIAGSGWREFGTIS